MIYQSNILFCIAITVFIATYFGVYAYINYYINNADHITYGSYEALRPSF